MFTPQIRRFSKMSSHNDVDFMALVSPAVPSQILSLKPASSTSSKQLSFWCEEATRQMVECAVVLPRLIVEPD